MITTPSQTILVTGGTGFLGRGLAGSLAGDHEVVLTGRNNKQNAFAAERTGCQVIPMDVTNIESVRDAVIDVRPDIVIHAAATKFVDLAERQPMECVDVNVLGSQNVARVVLDKQVPVLIGISTDKASPPIRNTYGMTKALMERMYCSLDARGITKMACVRYGNVAWSTGSVLPIWKEMHERSGVIGTTGPEMRRFFFTINEAVALVEQAIDRIDEIHGRVLSRQMKAAQIQHLLDLWTEERGGRWERIEGRPGERSDEFLIGELELPYTRAVDYDGVPHYIISFNERVNDSLSEVVSSKTVDRLSRAEMLDLINGARE